MVTSAQWVTKPMSKWSKNTSENKATIWKKRRRINLSCLSFKDTPQLCCGWVIHFMSAKTAIIILLLLAFLLAGVFGVIYFKRQANYQAVKQQQKTQIGRTGQATTTEEKLTPEQQKIKAIEDKTNLQVTQIIEQNKTSTGGVTKDAQRQIEDVVNQGIQAKLMLRTPEQIKADEQRQAERDRLEQEINQQIKSQLPK